MECIWQAWCHGGCLCFKQEGQRWRLFWIHQVQKGVDREMLLRKLNKEVWNSTKPTISLPKFDRNGNPISYRTLEEKRKQEINGGINNHFHASASKRFEAGGISFRDMVVPKTKQEIEVKYIDSNVSDTGATIRSGSLFGYVKDFQQFENLRDCIRSWGKPNTAMRYLGGLRVLMSFVSKEDAMDVLAKKDSWNTCFFSLTVWEGKKLEYERIAWLKISGIPPGIWGPEVSNQIASRFGEVICPSEADAFDGSLAFDVVGALAKNGSVISDLINLTWRKECHEVWVQECQTEWIPQCFKVESMDNTESFGSSDKEERGSSKGCNGSREGSPEEDPSGRSCQPAGEGNESPGNVERPSLVIEETQENRRSLTNTHAEKARDTMHGKQKKVNKERENVVEFENAGNFNTGSATPVVPPTSNKKRFRRSPGGSSGGSVAGSSPNQGTCVRFRKAKRKKPVDGNARAAMCDEPSFFEYEMPSLGNEAGHGGGVEGRQEDSVLMDRANDNTQQKINEVCHGGVADGLNEVGHGGVTEGQCNTPSQIRADVSHFQGILEHLQ